MADPAFPDLGLHGPAGKVDLDQDVFAVGASTGVIGRSSKSVVVVDGVLLAVAVDGLLEVALPIEQADADEGQVQVGGGLAVVAGEDAEAAGVDRQAFVEAELGAEVGDQVAFGNCVAMLVRHAGSG